MIDNQDIEFMRMAMNLADKGAGFVCPNPLVGAVIVKDGRCIADGYHHIFGDLHAERDALSHLDTVPDNCTIYVTLEPCCHYGKQPPCTDAIIASGIKRVVVGMADPNPKVAGKGIEILRQHGINVECGVLEDQLRYQNRAFLKHMTTGMPWVTLKSAITLDGKIATTTGDSKWVSDIESRNMVHRMRSNNQAILVGKNTVQSDNPMLNNRQEPDAYQPIRIVTDSQASLDTTFKIFTTAGSQRTILAHTGYATKGKLERLCDMGVEALCCNSRDGHVDMSDLFFKLGATGINSILIEGGGNVNFSIINNGLADELFFFVAPKIVGGITAPGPVGGTGITLMDNAIKIDIIGVVKTGSDLLIHGLFIK